MTPGGLFSEVGLDPSRCFRRNAALIPAGEVNNYIHAKVFRPFRVHMASGETFDVRHPEMAMVRQGVLTLFTSVSDSHQTLDRWDTLSLMLMERISFMEQR